MNIEIFKTNVIDESDANKLVKLLQSDFPKAEINFDLNDRDKVLRFGASQINIDKIISVVNSNGFECKIIPDKICD